MIEITAAILTIASAILATIGERFTWGIGILSCIFYGIVFVDLELWGMFVLQIIMIVQSVFGHREWKLLRIRNLSKRNLVRATLALTALFVPVAFMLMADKFTWVELAVCWSSLIANWMLVEGDPRNWNVWIVVNVTSVILFTLYRWAPISAITYTILLINSIVASWKWHHRSENSGKTAFS
jgi:nicotinamide riboside transporter PnuC